MLQAQDMANVVLLQGSSDGINVSVPSNEDGLYQEAEAQRRMRAEVIDEQMTSNRRAQAELRYLST